MAKKKSLGRINQRLVDLRLGIKLKDIFWPFDPLTVADVLTVLGYDNIQQTPDQRNILAEKKQVRFYADLPKLVFGFHADSPESIIESQKQFFAIIEKDLEIQLDKHVRFYEIEYRMKRVSQQNVFETLNDLYAESTDINAINQIVGLSVKPHGINVIKKEGSPENDSWYQIEILPLTSSVPKTFVCRLLQRDSSQKIIYNTLKKSSKVLEDLVSYLESE